MCQRLVQSIVTGFRSLTAGRRRRSTAIERVPLSCIYLNMHQRIRYIMSSVPLFMFCCVRIRSIIFYFILLRLLEFQGLKLVEIRTEHFLFSIHLLSTSIPYFFFTLVPVCPRLFQFLSILLPFISPLLPYIHFLPVLVSSIMDKNKFLLRDLCHQKRHFKSCV